VNAFDNNCFIKRLDIPGAFFILKGITMDKVSLDFVGVLDELSVSKSEKSLGTRYLTMKVLYTGEGEEKIGKIQLVAPPAIQLPKIESMHAQRCSVSIAPAIYQGKDGNRSLVLKVLDFQVKPI